MRPTKTTNEMTDQERIDTNQKMIIALYAQFTGLLAAIEKVNPELKAEYNKITSKLDPAIKKMFEKTK